MIEEYPIMIQERIFYLDNIRGVAIILVVIGHVLQSTLPIEYSQNSLFRFIYSFHMPLFMFISGSVYKGEISFNWFYRRMRILILPFIFWSIIYYLYNETDRPFAEYCTSVIKQPDISFWFLLILFYCNVFTLFFIRMRYWQEILLATSILLQVVPFSEYGLNLFKWMIFYFALGCIYKKHHSLLLKTRSSFIFIIIITSLILEILFYNISYKYVVYLNAIFPIIIISLLSFKYFNQKNHLFGVVLGQNTLQIYVTHFLFIKLGVQLFERLNIVDLQIFIGMMAILCSVLFSYIVKRNRIVDLILFGGK